MSGKSVFFINNHMPLLGYRILIILMRYPTFRFDLIDKLKMSPGETPPKTDYRLSAKLSGKKVASEKKYIPSKKMRSL